jgi:molybdopterin synthase catalytic subunit
MGMNEIKVLFFASLKEAVGVKETRLDWPEEARVADLKARLAKVYPALAPAMDSAIVSVNHEFAFDEELIPPGAEVALFPPVSGGMAEFPTILPSRKRFWISMDCWRRSPCPPPARPASSPGWCAG